MNRMLPRARARVGEIELECVCGRFLPYPTESGESEKSECPVCGTSWHMLEPMNKKKKPKVRTP